MSNIIHSSSLLNVADGKNEIPVDLSRPKETQQGIDFKDIYSGLANEASRTSSPVNQKPGDAFQKDLATIPQDPRDLRITANCKHKSPGPYNWKRPPHGQQQPTPDLIKRMMENYSFPLYQREMAISQEERQAKAA